MSLANLIGSNSYLLSLNSYGSTGPTGPQGIQGLTGPTGSQGKKGLTGPTGVSGISTISGASDVLITSLSYNQALLYDTFSSNWVNKSVFATNSFTSHVGIANAANNSINLLGSAAVVTIPAGNVGYFCIFMCGTSGGQIVFPLGTTLYYNNTTYVAGFTLTMERGATCTFLNTGPFNWYATSIVGVYVVGGSGPPSFP